MSYCRWSTDDFQSDVYVYENTGGYWSIHVASNRIVYHQPLPEPVPLTPDTAESWHDRNVTIMEWIDDPEKSHREAIDLPHAGEDFRADTPQETAEILTELRWLGYRIPEGVIDELRKEASVGRD